MSLSSSAATTTATTATAPSSDTAASSSSSLTDITNVEVDAMLEIAPKYCTRIRHCESMKSVVPDTQPPTVREDVPISSSARVFLLHNLLTPSECAHYIRETESLVYRDLSDEFDCDYRSNQRILVLSEKLADHLYSRMQLQLNRHDCLRVRPMCFGNSGTWKPVRLNECFKFGKYQQKQHFGTHIDGPWVPRTDESSIYTVLIYLNDDFTGGRTVFIPDDQRLQMDAKITEMRRTQCEEYDQIIGGGGGDGGATGSGGVSATMTNAATTTTSSSFTAGYTTNAADGIVTIQPRCGTALLFTHDTLHAGLPVMTGCKYVMRTELMFHRVDSEMIPSSIRESYQLDPAYQRTLKFYRESHEKNVKGDVTGFTNSYLEALKLQHQAQLSISADTRAIHALNLPIALYIHLFTYLNTRDLCRTLCVNHAWKDIAQDGVLWKMMYRIKFPHQLDAIVKMKILKQQQQQQQHLEQKVSSYNSHASNITLPHPAKIQLLQTSPTSKITSFSSFPGFSSSTPSSSSSSSPPPSLTIDPSIEDWYTIYKQRVILDHEFSPIIVDFGSQWTKVCLVKVEEEKEGEARRREEMRRIDLAQEAEKKSSATSSSPSSSSFTSSTSPLPPISTLFIGSCIARVPGIADLHMRQGCEQRIFLGRAAIEKYPDWVLHPFEHGRCIDVDFIPEFLAQAYLKLGTWSHKHPLVIAEPPFQWTQKFKVKFTRSIIKIFRIPAVTFVNSALLTAISQGRPDSAVVVNVGAETAWISGLNESRQLVLVNFTQTSMRPYNHECNEDFFSRHPEIRGNTGSDTERVTQTIITPSILAEGVLDTYLRMHTLCSTSRRPVGSTMNSVILTGGGTIAEEWRKSFTLELQALERKYNINNKDANSGLPQISFSSQYQTLAKVSEYPIITNSQSGKEVAAESTIGTALSSLIPFEIILPFDSSSPSTSSLTTTLLGGVIFSGFPSFRSYCITSFEFRQADSRPVTDDDDWILNFAEGEEYYSTREYQCVWTAYGTKGWIHSQFMYDLIEAHFTYDEAEKEYIANTSCSDDELDEIEKEREKKRKERREENGGVGVAVDDDDESDKAPPRIIYHRRTRHSGPRDKRKAPTESWEEENPVASPRAPSVHRRPRRSAFPVLPKMIKKWYEKQMKLRDDATSSRNLQPLSEEDRAFLDSYHSRSDVHLTPPSTPYPTEQDPEHDGFYRFMCSFWMYGVDPAENPDAAEYYRTSEALSKISTQLHAFRQYYGEAHDVRAPAWNYENDERWHWVLLQIEKRKKQKRREREVERIKAGEAEEEEGEEKKEIRTIGRVVSSSIAAGLSPLFKRKETIASTAATMTSSSSSASSSASSWSCEPESEEEDGIDEKYEKK